MDRHVPQQSSASTNSLCAALFFVICSICQPAAAQTVVYFSDKPITIEELPDSYDGSGSVVLTQTWNVSTRLVNTSVSQKVPRNAVVNGVNIGMYSPGANMTQGTLTHGVLGMPVAWIPSTAVVATIFNGTKVTADGPWTISWRATSVPTNSLQVVVSINWSTPPPPPSLHCISLGSELIVGRTGDTLTCKVEGGRPPYVGSVSAGGLPPGIRFYNIFGNVWNVGGTPTAAGVYSYVLRVRDSDGRYVDDQASFVTVNAYIVCSADYDGDGVTDPCTVLGSQWNIRLSSGATPDSVGIPRGWRWGGMGVQHRLALGDYDGDGKTDRAIVDTSAGTWFVIPSSGVDPATLGIPWGWQWGGMSSIHQLALGDYDGDGKTDRAIVDPHAGTWHVITSSGGDSGIPWGWQWGGMSSIHQLALGDYDGDGKTDRAIVDPHAGTWHVITSSGGDSGIPWGWQWGGMSSIHQLALGDYDGDGKTDRAIVDPHAGTWHVITSSGWDSGIPWGWQWGGMSSIHQLALGDYDGDGKTDRAIIHPPTNSWYIMTSSGAASGISWGGRW